jgi:hypothetical protein
MDNFMQSLQLNLEEKSNKKAHFIPTINGDKINNKNPKVIVKTLKKPSSNEEVIEDEITVFIWQDEIKKEDDPTLKPRFLKIREYICKAQNLDWKDINADIQTVLVMLRMKVPEGLIEIDIWNHSPNQQGITHIMKEAGRLYEEEEQRRTGKPLEPLEPPKPSEPPRQVNQTRKPAAQLRPRF